MLKTMADLFCGIGGFRLGLQGKVKCIFSCDFDKKAAAAYKQNFGDESDICRDILTIDKLPKTPDLICAGFPCQPFSTCGRHKETDSRNNLWIEILRLAINGKKPVKALLLENVPSFLTEKKGYIFGQLKKQFEANGYTLYPTILNAADYGCVQARKRVYIVCLHNTSKLTFVAPKPYGERRKMKEIMQAEKDIPKTLYIQQKLIKKPLTKKGYLDFLGYIIADKQANRVFRLNGCAPTQVSSSFGHGRGGGLYYINRKIRRLTLVEQKRIMGFPDDWILGTESASRKMLGNAVIPQMVRLVFDGIQPQKKKWFLNFWDKKKEEK